MNRFVLDCSFTMAWCFVDETTEETQAVLERMRIDTETVAICPALWLWEVSNVLVIAERRKRLSKDGAEAFAHHLSQLPIFVEKAPTWGDFQRLRALARTHQLSIYDACYLDLAIQYGIPLASRDKSLRKAAKQCDLELL